MFLLQDDGPKIKKLITIEEVREIAGAIKHPNTGIKVKDRRDFLHTHKGAFLGSDAKTWIQNYLPKKERAHAETYLQTLMDQGIFTPCSKKNKQFREKELYSFSVGSPSMSRAASAAVVSQAVNTKPVLRQSNNL